MLFATAKQGALFVWMMACGAAIGFWYALMAGLRRFIRAGFWLTLLCDLSFGAGSAVIFIAFLLAGSYGQLRLFGVIAAGLGAVYHHRLGRALFDKGDFIVDIIELKKSLCAPNSEFPVGGH